MSFFSGFAKDNDGYYYITSGSETIGSSNIFFVAIGSLYLLIKSIKKSSKFDIIFNIIFLIMSITLIIIYYNKKNEIIEIYIKNEKPDETINKIYFSLSIIISFIYFFYLLN
jgi:hypothetical protein